MVPWVSSVAEILTLHHRLRDVVFGEVNCIILHIYCISDLTACATSEVDSLEMMSWILDSLKNVNPSNNAEVSLLY